MYSLGTVCPPLGDVEIKFAFLYPRREQYQKLICGKIWGSGLYLLSNDGNARLSTLNLPFTFCIYRRSFKLNIQRKQTAAVRAL